MAIEPRPRRSFRDELRARIDADSKTFMLRPAEHERLVRDAGYCQGLKAALDLYEEITKANILPEDRDQ